jgi:hypothetical protein
MSSKTKINYNAFMSNLTVLHSYGATNFIEGLEFFVLNEGKIIKKEINEREINAITYDNTDKFLLFSNNSLQTDIDSNYYFEYTPKRECEIMDNINIKPIDKNIIISYYIGGHKYDPHVVKEFVFVSAMYNEFKIRFTFLEMPTENYEFSVCSRNYILKNDLRNYMRNNTLITDSMRYFEGMCIGYNKPKIVFYFPFEIMLVENSKIAHLEQTNITENELLQKYDIDYNSFYKNDIYNKYFGVIKLKSANEVHTFLLNYMNRSLVLS